MKLLTPFEQDLRLLTNEQLDEKYGKDWEKEGRPAPVASDIQPMLEEELPEPELPPPPYTGQAFGRFVMIRRLEKKHSARLVMPSRIAGTSDVGIVASAGEECKHIKAGDIVAFDQYASVGRELRLVDAEGLPGTFLIVEEPDILARLKKVCAPAS